MVLLEFCEIVYYLIRVIIFFILYVGLLKVFYMKMLLRIRFFYEIKCDILE